MPALLENDVKTLLAEKGVRVPAGFSMTRMRVAEADGRLPWKGGFAVKALVHAGSRQKSGLVRIETGPKDWRVSARAIWAKVPDAPVRVEERIAHRGEMYLAIVSDPVTRGPLLLFSRLGGVDIENVLAPGSKKLISQPLSILKGLDEAALRRRLSAAGVRSERDCLEIAFIARRLYELYREWDCRFIEINPLVRSGGALWALDGKMEFDEDAQFRIQDKLDQRSFEVAGQGVRSTAERVAARIDASDYRGSAHFVQSDVAAARRLYGRKLKALIGFNGVGTGVSLTAMDELVRLGFYPRNFCDTSGNPPASKLYRVTKIILSQDHIQGYFFITCLSSQQLDHTARGILKALRELYPKSGGVPPFPCLFMFRGAWDEEARKLFKEHGLEGAPHVRILGRGASERVAAEEFARLYEKFQKTR